ncbi:RT0821/Lpp0805 family surface protein [Gallaecimonas kandeliae]|uniref:RT0821/Lpp0805 family surface protein n=1 Tax=Gallaecimonas kandeliae TaxID=3029055 RepID=UPI0026480E02|nr:RT0821/Lpp0805 family surface protein [Gallaecimonas kandeliae]WKE66350.1 RT0821/Lpp0805 family surface protein [Gallaecimonas kandeliae]
MNSVPYPRLAAVALLGLALASQGALAGPGPANERSKEVHKEHKEKKEHKDNRAYPRPIYRHDDRDGHQDRDRHDWPAHPDRYRRYHHITIVRPYGPWYLGYGHYHSDGDAWKWLAFTAITLAILDSLNEAQVRAHEEAQIRATTAPINESIQWSQGNASGSVTPIREGTSTSGRYCREFQQQVQVGGRSQQAYGTACRNADGSWEIVSTGN